LDRRGKIGGWVVSPQNALDETSPRLDEYKQVDLANDSFLEEISDYAADFRVTMYKPSLMRAHHRPGRHEYLVVKCVQKADLFINLPKLKTHIKAGLSAALKNLVGINGHKEFLPHHTRGAYFDGGDCYCAGNVFSRLADRWYDDWWERQAEMPVRGRRVRAIVHRMLRAAAAGAGAGMISAGSWSGNETLWRTILDLNHLVYFGPQRPQYILTIVDGVIGGEGEGPLQPTPKSVGWLVAGENPACIDAVLARSMGYNCARIPVVYHALTHKRSQFTLDGTCDPHVIRVSDEGRSERLRSTELPNLDFRKPKYWRRAAIPRERPCVSALEAS
jgi:hypothetical protein